MTTAVYFSSYIVLENENCPNILSLSDREIQLFVSNQTVHDIRKEFKVFNQRSKIYSNSKITVKDRLPSKDHFETVDLFYSYILSEREYFQTVPTDIFEDLTNTEFNFMIMNQNILQLLSDDHYFNTVVNVFKNLRPPFFIKMIDKINGIIESKFFDLFSWFFILPFGDNFVNTWSALLTHSLELNVSNICGVIKIVNAFALNNEDIIKKEIDLRNLSY